MFRGEIWLIDLEPNIGAEIRKKRPAVIINSDEAGILPLKIVLPLTVGKSDMRKLRGWSELSRII
jgi:mRNA interferase MazF